MSLLVRAVSIATRSVISSSSRVNLLARATPIVQKSYLISSKSSTPPTAIGTRFLSSTPGLNNNVDKDLVTFLESEIEAEKSQTTLPKNGPGVPGFEVKSNGANVTLTRKVGNEIITIKLSVNGTVDADGPSEEEMEQMAANQNENATPPVGDMKSRPEFVVEIAKPSGRILAFNCRIYSQSETLPDQPEADKFEIDGFTVLNADQIDEDGDWDYATYVADGGIVDGQMYDLLMNLLDSRGINNEFIDSLVEYSTYYEHTKYITLLEAVKAFASEK